MSVRKERFQVRFWGVRGSYPTSSLKTLKFGGHTSCVEVEAGTRRLIFDAGTGIIPLGKKLLKSRRSDLNLYIFLSHTHHDHLIGLYFFEPLQKSNTRLFVFGPNSSRNSLKSTLRTAMDSQFFPIGLQELDARKEIFSLMGGEVVRFKAGSLRPKVDKKSSLEALVKDELTILSYKSHAHPKNGVMLYKVIYRDRSVVYATDIEEKKGGYPEVIEFVRGADLLIHDAQYLNSEYFSRTDPRKGWGHSTVMSAVAVAKKAAVKRLVLFHHEPIHNDSTVRKMEKQAQRLFPNAVAASEGMEVDLMQP